MVTAEIKLNNINNWTESSSNFNSACHTFYSFSYIRLHFEIIRKNSAILLDILLSNSQCSIGQNSNFPFFFASDMGIFEKYYVIISNNCIQIFYFNYNKSLI